MYSSVSSLSGEQIRAARALSRIDQSDLAKRSGLSLETIKRLERIRGPVDANSRTLRALFEVFSAMGVAFDNCENGGVGVCRAPQETVRSTVGTARSDGGGPRDGPAVRRHQLLPLDVPQPRQSGESATSPGTAGAGSGGGIPAEGRHGRHRNPVRPRRPVPQRPRGTEGQGQAGVRSDLVRSSPCIPVDHQQPASARAALHRLERLLWSVQDG